MSPAGVLGAMQRSARSIGTTGADASHMGGCRHENTSQPGAWVNFRFKRPNPRFHPLSVFWAELGPRPLRLLEPRDGLQAAIICGPIVTASWAVARPLSKRFDVLTSGRVTKAGFASTTLMRAPAAE